MPAEPGLLLDARDVFSGEDGGVLIAMAGENLDGSGAWIDFQLALEFTEQDTRLEMDTYCVATHEGHTHYGGIERVEPGDGYVDVLFRPAAAAKLQLPPRLRIGLGHVASRAPEFVALLQRIVG